MTPAPFDSRKCQAQVGSLRPIWSPAHFYDSFFDNHKNVLVIMVCLFAG
jgi:hypothetical protein